MSRRSSNVVAFPRAEAILAALERERARRPRLPIFAYRIDVTGERLRHELLCQICAGTFDEPARVYRLERATWARSCDRCGAINETNDGAKIAAK